MSKSLKVFVFILVLVLIVPAISLIKWTFQSKDSIHFLIMDKTVPTLKRNKHRSFNWILIHDKYVKGNGHPYSYKKDYFGFYPLKPLREKQYEIKRIRLGDIIDMANEYDGTYFTDTYGVYFNDWYEGISKGRRSRMIYGGLNSSDYLFLKEMKDRNKLIIAEYNILAFPTPELERNKVEDLLDIHWTGWIGKYFSSLDTLNNTELPEWVYHLYSEQTNKPWTFNKSGIVFIQFNNRVVVLENQNDLDFEVPYIYSSEHMMNAYKVPYKVNYAYWFNIVEPGKNEVLAYYKIHANARGDSIMQASFIPSEFPAVIEGVDESPLFYFAGDFADNPVKLSTAYFHGIEKCAPSVFYSDRPGDRRTFFWEYYKPLMTGILDKFSSDQPQN